MTLGTTDVLRWSQNSAPITTGQWCLIPEGPVLRRSSLCVPPPLQTIKEGGARLAWNLSIPQDPHCCPSAPGWLHLPPSSLLHLSFREGRRNIGEKHPAQREARGWRRCYIPPPINIQSVGEGPEKWPPRAKWCPTLFASLIYTPPLHTALEELGLRQEGGFPPPSLTHTLPPQLPGPLIGTPYSLSLPPLWL